MSDSIDDADELVVRTPERVTLTFALAGVGSRFIAQLVDVPVQLVLMAVSGLAALGYYRLTGNPRQSLLVGLALAFIAAWGYYPVSEILWSGRTLGKKVAGIRVVGDRGEPLTGGQAVIRNLVRLVDFLPILYGLGMLVLFWNGRGKRLGDIAAGTVVVRDRAAVRLRDLQTAAADPGVGQAGEEPGDRELHPRLMLLPLELRRFVVSYAERRHHLGFAHRERLAEQVRPALERAVPARVARLGPLATLEELAGWNDMQRAGATAGTFLQT